MACCRQPVALTISAIAGPLAWRQFRRVSGQALQALVPQQFATSFLELRAQIVSPHFLAPQKLRVLAIFPRQLFCIVGALALALTLAGFLLAIFPMVHIAVEPTHVRPWM